MDAVNPGSEHDEARTDRSAILMMLAYVEAECRRLGVTEAAQHAAQAAALLSPSSMTAAPRRSTALVAMPLVPLH
ncbi:hypothetical protein KPL78_10685 [Roseomonas sp. HJA6]|uniref:Uncharacterized protein n=1 Tax=Roseomonas alba TaxID=2846776 RepID=A0ABS7A7S2_9PROT|nr:hypothetical protein [Neoroseomonas alba]MBW6398316.1 hypothetical protein [Neoroseomonas alba]